MNEYIVVVEYSALCYMQIKGKTKEDAERKAMTTNGGDFRPQYLPSNWRLRDWEMGDYNVVPDMTMDADKWDHRFDE